MRPLLFHGTAKSNSIENGIDQLTTLPLISSNFREERNEEITHAAPFWARRVNATLPIGATVVTLAFLAILAILASIAGAIIYLLGWTTSRLIGYALRGRHNQQLWQSRGKYAVMAGTVILFVYVFHFATQGSDDFHLERFSLVALRDPPKLARVVAKSSSSFGLHSGDSCVYTRIELPRQDYSELLASIAADPRFASGTRRYERIVEGKSVIYEESKVPESEFQTEVWRDAGYIPEKMSYVRLVPDEFWNHYALSFLSDEKHIEVSSCI